LIYLKRRKFPVTEKVSAGERKRRGDTLPKEKKGILTPTFGLIGGEPSHDVLYFQSTRSLNRRKGKEKIY